MIKSDTLRSLDATLLDDGVGSLHFSRLLYQLSRRSGKPCLGALITFRT